MLDYILWSPDPEIFHFGNVAVRWYGLLFAMGFIVTQQIMFYMFKVEKKPVHDVESLTIYMVIGTIIGARLGHTLFYEPQHYLSNPLDILKIWEGGLASHGAAVGILLALYLYVNYKINLSFTKPQFKKQKREGQSYLWIVDRIVIVVALAGCFIRFGNFMNSEIIGKPTGTDDGVVFARGTEDLFLSAHDAITAVKFHQRDGEALYDNAVPVTISLHFDNSKIGREDAEVFAKVQSRYILTQYSYASGHFRVDANEEVPSEFRQDGDKLVADLHVHGIPRHPAQLYESFSSLLIFFGLLWFWRRNYATIAEGKIFGLFLVVLFTLRFLYEFLKENQVAFEDTIPLNMGQWLSIPLVIIGILLLVFRKKPKSST